MLLVRGESGTRVVSVPAILVGAEQIIPAGAAAASPAADGASVAF
jgi:hypothetical protein